MQIVIYIFKRRDLEGRVAGGGSLEIQVKVSVAAVQVHNFSVSNARALELHIRREGRNSWVSAEQKCR